MYFQYLYFDVQTIMGGRRIELSPDEIIFATTQIYVDIVLLYQYLLMFMGFFHRWKKTYKHPRDFLLYFTLIYCIDWYISTYFYYTYIIF